MKGRKTDMRGKKAAFRLQGEKKKKERKVSLPPIPAKGKRGRGKLKNKKPPS